MFHSSLDDPKPTVEELRADLDRRIKEVEQAELQQQAAERRAKEQAEEARMEEYDRERKAKIAEAAGVLQAKTNELHVKTHDYSQELAQVAKAAPPLLATLRQYVKEFDPILSPLRQVNQHDLVQFYRPDSRSAHIASQLWRRLEEVNGIFSSTTSALESLPKRTRQIDNMVGLSAVPEIRYVNALKQELRQHRDSVEAVPGMIRTITRLAEELAVLLRNAGAPVATWQVMHERPNLTTTVTVDGDVVVER